MKSKSGCRAFHEDPYGYRERCQRCGHNRLDHKKIDGSGQCNWCKKKCNRFIDKALKEKS